MKRRALALLCAGILAVGMLAGCGGSSDKKDSSAKTEDTKKEAKSDGTFTFALNYMPNSLQPSAQSSDDLVSAIRPIYEPLFAETKDGLEYYLADKLDISEDGLTYTLHINDKATWSDGEPVTVKDIKFTIDYGVLVYGGPTSFTKVNGGEVQINEIDEKSSGLEGKELTYIYNSDRANMESVATVVQQQLAEIGVTVNIESCDTSTFFPRFFASKDKELATTWDLGTNGWDSQRGSNCGQAISYFTNRLCDCGYSDEVSGLAQKAIGTADAKEKQELWNTIQDKALEECWEYPLTYTNFVMVSQKNVTGLDGSSVVPEFIDYLSIHMD